MKESQSNKLLYGKEHNPLLDSNDTGVNSAL